MSMPAMKSEAAVAAPAASAPAEIVTMTPKRAPVAEKYIKMARHTAVHVIPPLVVLALLLLFWELACRRAGSALPPPSRVFKETKELIFDPFFDRGGIDTLCIDVPVAASVILPRNDCAAFTIGDHLELRQVYREGAHPDAVRRPLRNAMGIDPLEVDVEGADSLVAPCDDRAPFTISNGTHPVLARCLDTDRRAVLDPLSVGV